MNFDPSHDRSARFISKGDGWVLHYVQSPGHREHLNPGEHFLYSQVY